MNNICRQGSSSRSITAQSKRAASSMEEAPKQPVTLRKACCLCVRLKRACDGKDPCQLCRKRREECKRSVKRKSGPAKGTKYTTRRQRLEAGLIETAPPSKSRTSKRANAKPSLTTAAATEAATAAAAAAAAGCTGGGNPGANKKGAGARTAVAGNASVVDAEAASVAVIASSVSMPRAGAAAPTFSRGRMELTSPAAAIGGTSRISSGAADVAVEIKSCRGRVVATSASAGSGRGRGTVRSTRGGRGRGKGATRGGRGRVAASPAAAEAAASLGPGESRSRPGLPAPAGTAGVGGVRAAQAGGGDSSGLAMIPSHTGSESGDAPLCLPVLPWHSPPLPLAMPAAPPPGGGLDAISGDGNAHDDRDGGGGHGRACSPFGLLPNSSQTLAVGKSRRGGTRDPPVAGGRRSGQYWATSPQAAGDAGDGSTSKRYKVSSPLPSREQLLGNVGAGQRADDSTSLSMSMVGCRTDLRNSHNSIVAGSEGEGTGGDAPDGFRLPPMRGNHELNRSADPHQLPPGVWPLMSTNASSLSHPFPTSLGVSGIASSSYIADTNAAQAIPVGGGLDAPGGGAAHSGTEREGEGVVGGARVGGGSGCLAGNNYTSRHHQRSQHVEQNHHQQQQQQQQQDWGYQGVMRGLRAPTTSSFAGRSLSLTSGPAATAEDDDDPLMMRPAGGVDFDQHEQLARWNQAGGVSSDGSGNPYERGSGPLASLQHATVGGGGRSGGGDLAGWEEFNANMALPSRHGRMDSAAGGIGAASADGVTSDMGISVGGHGGGGLVASSRSSSGVVADTSRSGGGSGLGWVGQLDALAAPPSPPPSTEQLAVRQQMMKRLPPLPSHVHQQGRLELPSQQHQQQQHGMPVSPVMSAFSVPSSTQGGGGGGVGSVSVPAMARRGSPNATSALEALGVRVGVNGNMNTFRSSMAMPLEATTDGGFGGGRTGGGNGATVGSSPMWSTVGQHNPSIVSGVSSSPRSSSPSDGYFPSSVDAAGDGSLHDGGDADGGWGNTGSGQARVSSGVGPGSTSFLEGNTALAAAAAAASTSVRRARDSFGMKGNVGGSTAWSGGGSQVLQSRVAQQPLSAGSSISFDRENGVWTPDFPL